MGFRYEKMMRPASDSLANLPGNVEYPRQVSSVFQRTLAGALDYRAVGDRIAERHAQLDHIRTGANGRKCDVARSVEIRIAAGDVGDEAGTICESYRQDLFSRANIALYQGTALAVPQHVE